MRNNYRPTPSEIKERRKKESTQQVFIPPEEIDEEYLDKFLGRIFFWSFTISKIRPDDQTTKFRVCTHRYISPYVLTPLIEKVIPGCKVNPVAGYSFRHTFDVKTVEPLRWDDFMWLIVNALETKL